MVTPSPEYNRHLGLVRILVGLYPFFIGAAIYMFVRRLTKKRAIAVLTAILLIAAYIGLQYFALAYGLHHSRPGDF
jgi:hypothetical protein